MQNQTVLYTVRFFDKALKPVEGLTMSDLARFESNALYKVEGPNGRDLTESELNQWELESSAHWAGIPVLPLGLGQRKGA